MVCHVGVKFDVGVIVARNVVEGLPLDPPLRSIITRGQIPCPL